MRKSDGGKGKVTRQQPSSGHSYKGSGGGKGNSGSGGGGKYGSRGGGNGGGDSNWSKFKNKDSTKGHHKAHIRYL
jgi:hypothetical protein